MNESLALSLLGRLRVPRGARRDSLHTGELLGVARFWAQASFDAVAFLPTRIRLDGDAPLDPEILTPAQPERLSEAVTAAPLASGAQGPTPLPAAPGAGPQAGPQAGPAGGPAAESERPRDQGLEAAPPARGVLPEAPCPPHGGSTASALALNPSMRLLASGGWDRAIRLWRLTGDGEGAERPDDAFVRVADLRGHQGVILGLTWANAAPDRSFLVSCSNDGRVICWEVRHPPPTASASAATATATGSGDFEAKPLWSWKGQDAGAQVSSITAAQTPDGRWLLSAVKQNGLVMLWDRNIWEAESGGSAAGAAGAAVGEVPLKPPNGVVKTPFFLGVRSAVLHPRGESILVAGNDKMFKGFVLALPITAPAVSEDLKIAEEPLHMEGRHEGGVRCMTVSACGENVISGAFGSRQNILVHRVVDGSLQQSLEGHESGVAAMALDGQFLVTAGDDGSLRIWRWVLGRCLKVLRGEGAMPVALRMKAVAFSVEQQRVRIIGATEKTKQNAGQLLLWGDADASR